jgi:peptidoglycan/LPS O-acetylase OafA/YrhL
MKNGKLLKIIPWVKRVLAILTIVIWIAVILKIAGSPAPFLEEAPYCIASTMIIFGLLTAAFKGLELLEKRFGPKTSEGRK